MTAKIIPFKKKIILTQTENLSERIAKLVHSEEAYVRLLNDIMGIQNIKKTSKVSIKKSDK